MSFQALVRPFSTSSGSVWMTAFAWTTDLSAHVSFSSFERESHSVLMIFTFSDQVKLALPVLESSLASSPTEVSNSSEIGLSNRTEILYYSLSFPSFDELGTYSIHWEPAYILIQNISWHQDQIPRPVLSQADGESRR